MPYTYEDFQSYLPQAGLTEDEFSPEDLALAKSNPTAGVQLIEAKSDYKNATTDDQRFVANAKANQIRSQAGYSGGIDGVNGNASLTPDDLPGYSSTPTTGTQSSAIPTQQYTPPNYSQPYDMGGQTPSSFQSAPPPAPFSYDKQAPIYQSTGTYNNQFADQQKQLLGDVTNYKPFEFNADTNPQMQAYTKQYRREGDRAMQDTIGSLSAATGGIPSTAVASAAGQANDYYMSQLGDKLPQIYESEFNKYLQEFGMAKDKLGAVNAQENIDYTKYWDGEKFNFDKYLADQSQYNAERGQSLNEYQVGLGQYNTDRNFNYGQTMDDLNYKTDANNTAYARSVTADNTAYSRAFDSKEFDYRAGRDLKEDEQVAFDQKYKTTVLDNDAKSLAYNKAVDRFQVMGYADEQTAKDLGVPAGVRFGGEEAEIALEQSRKNLELTQANINNTNANTANVGKTSGAGGGYENVARVNAAYSNVESGNYTGGDIAILKDAGWSVAEIESLKGGSNTGPSDDDVSMALSNLEDPTAGTMADIEILLAAGADEAELKQEYPWIWDPSLLPTSTTVGATNIEKPMNTTKR